MPFRERPGRGDAFELGGGARTGRGAAQRGGHVVAQPGRGGGGSEQARRDGAVGRHARERGGRVAARPQLVGDAAEGVGELAPRRSPPHAGDRAGCAGADRR